MSRRSHRRTRPSRPGQGSGSHGHGQQKPGQQKSTQQHREEPSSVPEPVLVVDHEPEEFWGGEVDERQLELLIGDWRKGRTTRNIWQALGDAYVLVFSLLVVLAMIVSLIVQAQGQAAGCDTTGCRTARQMLPWAALAGVLAFALTASRIFGPVLASAAEGFWLMDAPIDRSRFLVKRLRLALLVALVGGAVLGALVSSLTGSGGAAIIAWTVATGVGAAGMVAFAAAEQGAERVRTVKVAHAFVALVGAGALVAVLSTAAGWYTVSVDASTSLLLAWGVAAGGAVLLVAAGLVARARLNDIRRARLMAGGSLAAGMQGAAFALDFALIRDILQEREAVERGQVRPTRGRGLGLRALVWRDVQRVLRFPRPLLTLAVTVVVPYAVQALGLGRMSSPVSALVLVAALVPFFTSLRVFSRTKGLLRCLPFPPSQVRTAASAVPAVLALLWSVAVVPAFHGIGAAATRTWPEAVMYALVTGAAGLLGAIRWVSAKPADYSSPMVATQAGAMPPGLMFNLVRGLDMVAIVTIWLVLGLSPWISIVVALVAFGFLRMGGMDAQELQQMQEESRRQLAEQKALAKGEKVGHTEKKVVTRRR